MALGTHRRWLKTVLTIIVMVPLSATADIYKCVNEQGTTTFSNTPCGSDAVKVRATVQRPKAETPPAETVAKDKPDQAAKGRAVVTLVDGAKVELITKTMYLYRGLSTSVTNTLNLPNGLRIPFLEIKDIKIEAARDKSSATIQVQRHDGNTVADKFTKPWINIAGDNDLGRFR